MTETMPDSGKNSTLEEAISVIGMLLERVSRLESENQELRAEVARLKKNSSTSSKPPSSDITKPESELRQPGKRKRGGQPGHKGFWRQQVEPDDVKDLHLKSCPECGNTHLGAEHEGDI